jgi:hypothetical protein
MVGDGPGGEVRIEAWGDDDLELLERLVGDRAMMTYVG